SLVGTGLEMAGVLVESAGILSKSGETDEQGNLTLKNLLPGAYTVKVLLTGYQKKMFGSVLVKEHETTYLEVQLSSGNMMIDFVKIEWKKPLIDPGPAIKVTFNTDDIKRSPMTNVNDFMSTAPRAVQMREGATPNFGGSRDDAVLYIVDGVPVRNFTGVSMGAIQQMSVTLGGVPAMYGDATGAIIEIETKSGLVNPN
ncbi:MAG TPA: TonB-dependent receptor plug domain-containing protein, partial [Bacteroidia bacterium]